MNVLEMLEALDQLAFIKINTGMSNALFDGIMPYFREKWFWAPLYVFIVAFLALNFGRKGWLIVLGIVLSVGIADYTSSTIIKKNVQRTRPCNDPGMSETIVLRVDCGSGYSMTSSHASNHFAVAVFLSVVLGGMARWIRPVALLWAAAIAFAQVYVGVHYPADVTLGALLGAVIGWWLGRLRIFRLEKII